MVVLSISEGWCSNWFISPSIKCQKSVITFLPCHIMGDSLGRALYSPNQWYFNIEQLYEQTVQEERQILVLFL